MHCKEADESRQQGENLRESSALTDIGRAVRICIVAAVAIEPAATVDQPAPRAVVGERRRGGPIQPHLNAGPQPGNCIIHLPFTREVGLLACPNYPQELLPVWRGSVRRIVLGPLGQAPELLGDHNYPAELGQHLPGEVGISGAPEVVIRQAVPNILRERLGKSGYAEMPRGPRRHEVGQTAELCMPHWQNNCV